MVIPIRLRVRENGHATRWLDFPSTWVRSSNESKVLEEEALPVEVVELGRSDPFVLPDSSVLGLGCSEWPNL